jgi:hypothetical protein
VLVGEDPPDELSAIADVEVVQADGGHFITKHSISSPFKPNKMSALECSSRLPRNLPSGCSS